MKKRTVYKAKLQKNTLCSVTKLHFLNYLGGRLKSEDFGLLGLYMNVAMGVPSIQMTKFTSATRLTKGVQ